MQKKNDMRIADNGVSSVHTGVLDDPFRVPGEKTRRQDNITSLMGDGAWELEEILGEDTLKDISKQYGSMTLKQLEPVMYEKVDGDIFATITEANSEKDEQQMKWLRRLYDISLIARSAFVDMSKLEENIPDQKKVQRAPKHHAPVHARRGKVTKRMGNNRRLEFEAIEHRLLLSGNPLTNLADIVPEDSIVYQEAAEIAYYGHTSGDINASLDAPFTAQTFSVLGTIRRGNVGPEAANEDVVVSLGQQSQGSDGLAGSIFGFRWDKAHAYIVVNNEFVLIESEKTFTETDRDYTFAATMNGETGEVILYVDGIDVGRGVLPGPIDYDSNHTRSMVANRYGHRAGQELLNSAVTMSNVAVVDGEVLTEEQVAFVYGNIEKVSQPPVEIVKDGTDTVVTPNVQTISEDAVMYRRDGTVKYAGYDGGDIDASLDAPFTAQTFSVWGKVKRGNIGPEAANQDVLMSLGQQIQGAGGLAGSIFGFRWDKAYAYIVVNNTFVLIQSEQTFTETDREYTFGTTVDGNTHEVVLYVDGVEVGRGMLPGEIDYVSAGGMKSMEGNAWGSHTGRALINANVTVSSAVIIDGKVLTAEQMAAMEKGGVDAILGTGVVEEEKEVPKVSDDDENVQRSPVIIMSGTEYFSGGEIVTKETDIDASSGHVRIEGSLTIKSFDWGVIALMVDGKKIISFTITSYGSVGLYNLTDGTSVINDASVPANSPIPFSFELSGDKAVLVTCGQTLELNHALLEKFKLGFAGRYDARWQYMVIQEQEGVSEEVQMSTIEKIAWDTHMDTVERNGEDFLVVEGKNGTIAIPEDITLVRSVKVIPGPIVQSRIRAIGIREDGSHVTLYDEYVMSGDGDVISWYIPDDVVRVTEIQIEQVNMSYEYGDVLVGRFTELKEEERPGQSLPSAVWNSWEHIKIPTGFSTYEQAEAFRQGIDKIMSGAMSTLPNPYLALQNADSILQIMKRNASRLVDINKTIEEILSTFWLQDHISQSEERSYQTRLLTEQRSYVWKDIAANLRKHNLYIYGSMAEAAKFLDKFKDEDNCEEKARSAFSALMRDGPRMAYLGLHHPSFVIVPFNSNDLFNLVLENNERLESLHVLIDKLYAATNNVGVDGNEVRDYLKEFLNSIPDWMREFFDNLPAEAARAFRAMYADGAYWTGNVEYEDRVIGKTLAVMIEQGLVSEATELGQMYAGNPSATIAMLEDGLLKDKTMIVTLKSVTTIVQAGGVYDIMIASETFNAIGFVRETLDLSPAQMYTEVMGWYDVNGAMPTINFDVQNDSHVGRLFLGLVQKLQNAHDNSEERVRIAILAESVTDIPASKILDTLESDGVSIHAIRNLFEIAEYGMIFDHQMHEENTSPSIVYGNVDYPSYTNGYVRVRFDVIGAGQNFKYVEVYSPNTVMVENACPTDPIIAGSRDRLFVDVPVSKIGKDGNNIQLNLLAYFDNTTDFVATESFAVEWDGSVEKEQLPHNVPSDTWDALSLAEKQHILSTLEFPNLDNYPGNKAIIDHLFEKYLATGELEFTQGASVLSNDFRWIGKNAIDNCKIWIQQHVVRQATLESDSFSSSVIIPNTDQEAPYKWLVDSNTKNVIEIAQHDGSTGVDLKSILQLGSVMPGDIIQMGGNFSGTNQHTAIIGKIEADGFWVFDSNWEKTNTPAYHYYEYVRMQEILNSFTIYRVF